MNIGLFPQVIVVKIQNGQLVSAPISFINGEKKPRFLGFQKVLRTSHDFAQNHVDGALFDVSKVPGFGI